MGVPITLQLDITDCGPACLHMIAQYYELEIPFETIKYLSAKSRTGTSLLGLSEAAEKLGFSCIGARLKITDLIDGVPLPGILYFQNDHFVVLTKIKRKKFYINDPAFGKRVLTYDELLEEWSPTSGGDEGVGLFFDPVNLDKSEAFIDDSISEKEDTSSTFTLIYRRLASFKGLLFQVFLGLVVGSCLQLVFPFLTQGIVDIGIKQQNMSYIQLILFAQLFIYTGIVLTGVIRSVILMHISTRVNVRLLSDFFKKLFKLPISYYDNKITGDILQRVQDHVRLEMFLTTGSLNVVFSLFNIILFGIVLGYYNINILLIFLLGSVLYVLWIFAFMKQRAEVDFQKFRQLSDNSDKILEILNGMPDIKINGTETRKRWEWEYLQGKLFKVNLRGLSIENWQNSGSQLINEVKNIIITVYTASLVIEGDITLGMMLAIAFILGQVNAPLSQLNNFIRLYHDAKLSLSRINETYKKEDEFEANTLADTHYDQDIILRNLTFKYSGTRSAPTVIDDINLVIPAKKITAIVGSSGSGKSTLMKILLKFYSPTEGKIFIGKNDLSVIDNREWRANIGVVLQNGFIFNDTIGNNITLSTNLPPDEDKLVEAAKMANIHEFISSLPMGYRTKIGDTGQTLSTGQRQRILIARSIYKDPDVLFFDEATSALDARNEFEITKNLEKVFTNKTVLIIAHRLSTVKNADKIVVLDNGKVIEEGNHLSLVAKQGAYFDLVKNQLELQ